jgi:hypothetical protein
MRGWWVLRVFGVGRNKTNINKIIIRFPKVPTPRDDADLATGGAPSSCFVARVALHLGF